MKIKDIIEMEKTNLSGITLLKEGMFFRAYNRSAMRISTKVKVLKVNTKLIKYVGQTVMYCGFPDNILPEISNLCVQKNYGWNVRGEKRIDIEGVATTDEDYEGWVSAVIKKAEAVPSLVAPVTLSEILRIVNVQFEQLRFMARLAKDLKHISIEQYDSFLVRNIEIERMADGWGKGSTFNKNVEKPLPGR